MKKVFFGLFIFVCALLGSYYLIVRKSPVPIVELPASPKPVSTVSLMSPVTPEKPIAVAPATPRYLSIPPQPAEPAPPPVVQKPTPTSVDLRSEGRKKRANLPLGVVLWDAAAVLDDSGGTKRLYEMMTGDFVRVLPDPSVQNWIHIQPGVDVYLAQTSKSVEPAGERFPDKAGWIDKKNLHIFDPDQAKNFLFSVEPMTLGSDPNYSTLEFLERAMRNPDPVVHRVIGPRLIALADMHEDYVTSWKNLYRDNDPKIRAAALSSLRQRGVANSRPIIEDLIQRLSELTQTRATGETEAEVLLILDVLRESHHPRVPAALQSFLDTWKESQSEKVIEALQSAIQTQ